MTVDGQTFDLDHGHVVIAAITSCTNTSNPSVMVGAGILARNALARGLQSKPWVKTSLAPGSKVVTEYLDRAGLDRAARAARLQPRRLRLHDLHRQLGAARAAEISEAVADADLAVVSVLSGNRNFEGRINPDVKMNYLASPPLCVAYALAGTMDIDLAARSARPGRTGRGRLSARHLAVGAGDRRDGRPRRCEPTCSARATARCSPAIERWNGLDVPEGERFAWEEQSTYVRLPPYFEGMPAQPPPVAESQGARVLAMLGDSVTTDHISPAGAIKRDGPAGALSAGAGRGAARLQLLRRRAAATTR